MRFNSTINSTFFLCACAGILLFSFVPSDALASSTTGLPWEGPLETIKRSLTGPVALIFAVLGLAVAGLSLVFAGGEMSEFVRRVVMLILVISLVVGASSAISILFGTSSAVIADTQSIGLSSHV